jgi:thioesterase domain-containing protein/aryl carrier-like protein
VGITDNFFELGGDSIITIKVVGQIKRLGYEIEPMDLFINQTVEGLSELLEARSGEPIDKKQELVDERNIDAASSNLFNYKFLVPIKPGENKLPLYIVSGGGGTVIKFKKMVDLLDTDQPVFGLQQPTNAKDLEEFPDTIESIASSYIAELLIQNPDGPYAISGHCAGGIIAYEMSKQLEAMGKKVVFLAMFDTIAPTVKEENIKEKKSINNFTFWLKRSILKAYLKADFETFLFRRHTKRAFEYKLNSIKSLVKSIVPASEEDDVYMLYKRLENSFRHAQHRYNTLPYNGNLVLYYAKYHYRFFDSNRDVRYRKFTLSDNIKKRWNQYATSVEIFEVEGEHSTMFDPAVGGRELAGLLQEKLNSCIKEALTS